MKLFFSIISVCLIGLSNLFGQTTLPFFEGFEDIGTTTTFTSGTTSINGLSEWTYENTNRGRVRFKVGTAFYNTGSAAATFDVSRNNSTSTNYLILTLDLRNYSSSNLELNFKYMHHGEESNTADRIWVRGTNTDSWVELYNWYSNRANAGTWKIVEGVDIDAVLTNASQTIGSTFQLRIGQADNFQVRSTTRDDGVTFDDLEIVERFEREGQMVEYRNFCAGTSDLEALVFNQGIDTIKTAQIDWWVNGSKQKGFNFSGSVAPGESQLVTLGSATFISGNNLIEAVFDSINGNVDQVRNDTLKINQAPGLSGNYTIGGSSADFNTFSDAINVLNKSGVCGSVNFTINNATYSGSNTLGPVEGLNKNNTLTFDGQDSSKTIITHNGSTDRTTLRLSGLRWVTFKNIGFRTTGTSRSWALHLNEACRNIRFENCQITANTSGTTQDVIGLVASASTTSQAVNGDNVESLNILNCRFEGGERSIQIMGPLVNYSSSFNISNNVFASNYYSAIGIYNLKNVVFENNKLTTFRDNGANAIVMYDIDEFDISNNYISSRNYGVYAEDANINGNSASTFTNNIITTSGHGAYFNNTRSLEITHNTIIGGPAIRFNSYSGVTLTNNILYGNGGYAFYCPTANGFDKLDWNHYYSTITNKYNYDNINFGSLSAWQTFSAALNQNAIESAPSIISTANPYLSTTKAAERAPSIGVLTDIDGDTRCSIAPSIGADESTYSNPKPSASFTLADSSFVDAIVQVKNGAGATDLLVHEWFVNNVRVDSGNLNLNYQFPKNERYKVTLKSTNCGSFDTTSKFIIITQATKAVVPRLNASKTSISVGETVTLLNRSINGPDTISWTISPYFDGKKTRTFFYTNGTDSSSYEPVIYFTTPGDYTVCLYASNKLGGGTKCKTDLITVADEVLMCEAAESSVSEGVLRDPGGTGNYAGRQGYNCNFTLTPCAKNLKLTFTEFDITNNRDYLKIYDGKDNTGSELHSYNTSYSNGLTGDDNASAFQNTLTAKSGSAYFEFTTNWFFGAPGFEIEWSSTPIVVPAPVAGFDIPDTICLGTDLNIENNSSGEGNRYFWEVQSKITNSVEYTDSAVNHFFFFAGKYTVQLIVRNCGGSDTMTKNIVVVEPTAKPTAKLAVDIPNPDKGQIVTLFDVSTLKGYLCSEYRTWKITPASKFNYVTGYGSQNQITKVTFSDTGCFDIQLIASNSNGIDTVLVKCAVRVIDRCVPKVSNLDADVGIARVSLGDINNSSLAGQTAYTDYRADFRTELQQGADYDISVFRDKGPQSDMNRAVWIDYNQDGDFNDKGETVARSASAVRSVVETFNFKVPNLSKLGATTMRVGVSKNSSNNTPCGTNVNGEFEDYLVIITEDSEAPVLTLYGAKTDTIEQCSAWIDPKGFAIDNVLNDTIPLTIIDTLDASIVGIHILRYSAVDSNMNADTITRRVVILPDATAPVLTLYGSDSVYVEVNTAYTDAGYTVNDNCLGVQDTVICVVDVSVIGVYQCIYTAKDINGNTTQVERRIYVGDKTPPVFDSLIGGDTIYHQINTPYSDKGAVYKDNYDSNSDITLIIKGEVDTTIAGEYTLWYIATDKNGNKDSTFRKVFVADYFTPKVSLIGPEEITIDVFDVYTDDSVTYTNYDGTTGGLTLNRTGTYIDSFGLNGQATLVGTFYITYTVENTTGGTTTLSRTINVVDRIAPVITLLGADPMFVKEKADFIEPGWTVTDNYWKNPHIWVYSYGVVNTLVPDTYYVSYYAADSSANVSAVITREVIVEKAVGLNNLENSLSVYPNPTNGQLNVDFLIDNEARLELSIIDMLGREITIPFTQRATGISVDLSAFKDGNYMLVLKSENAIRNFSIIKQ